MSITLAICGVDVASSELRGALPAALASAPGSSQKAPLLRAEASGAVAAALADARRRVVSVAAFSGAINVLTLSGSIYMAYIFVLSAFFVGGTASANRRECKENCSAAHAAA